MTPPYRKQLIEVALPLKAINEASATGFHEPDRSRPAASARKVTDPVSRPVTDG